MSDFWKLFLFFLVVAIVTTPVTLFIKKKIKNKNLAVVVDLLVSCAILLLMFLIVDLFGYR